MTRAPRPNSSSRRRWVRAVYRRRNEHVLARRAESRQPGHGLRGYRLRVSLQRCRLGGCARKRRLRRRRHARMRRATCSGSRSSAAASSTSGTDSFSAKAPTSGLSAVSRRLARKPRRHGSRRGARRHGRPAARRRLHRDAQDHLRCVRDSRAAQIEAFLPPGGAKGAFTFPAPYNTSGVRLTNASDCAGGQDCLWYAGYSYWRNMNNHVGSADMYIFLGTDRNHGGVGPILLRYNKVTDAVQNLGPLFRQPVLTATAPAKAGTSAAPIPRAFTSISSGTPQLRRYDVLQRQFETVPALDLARVPAPATSVRRRRRSSSSRIRATTTSCTRQPSRTLIWGASDASSISSAARKVQVFRDACGLPARRVPCRQVRTAGSCCSRRVRTDRDGTASSTFAAARSPRSRTSMARSAIWTWGLDMRSAPTRSTRCRTRRSC